MWSPTSSNVRERLWHGFNCISFNHPSNDTVGAWRAASKAEKVEKDVSREGEEMGEIDTVDIPIQRL